MGEEKQASTTAKAVMTVWQNQLIRRWTIRVAAFLIVFLLGSSRDLNAGFWLLLVITGQVLGRSQTIPDRATSYLRLQPPTVSLTLGR